MSEHGKILGAEFAAIADKLAPLHPDIPERCKTCAFRLGTTPNQSAGTLVEAMHCILGVDPAIFGCHQTLKGGIPMQSCSGYLLARRAEPRLRRQALDFLILQRRK